MRNDQVDPENPSSVVKGARKDADLIAQWKNKRGSNAKYVTNRADLMALSANTEYVLGRY